MNSKATKQNTLDEQAITKAAMAALHDLELDIEVKSVEADGDNWCVQFTTEYRQVCDTFRDQFGQENSFELIREKIKRSILKQQQTKIRSGVRIRRGKTEERRPTSDVLLQTALKTIGGAVGQTAEAAGEIIKQASHLPEQALTALADATGSASAASGTTHQSVEGVEQPLARVRVKVAAKSTAKRRPAARKATSKKGPAAKKAAKKKATSKSKRASVKSSAKSGTKRTGTKSGKKAK
ncbi:MAG TPA: hypothetical protein VF658_18645 [Pyrinomonadaceae bacterium]|jgi:hypothetical protein